jgi:hypothetical protein
MGLRYLNLKRHLRPLTSDDFPKALFHLLTEVVAHVGFVTPSVIPKFVHGLFPPSLQRHLNRLLPVICRSLTDEHLPFVIHSLRLAIILSPCLKNSKGHLIHQHQMLTFQGTFFAPLPLPSFSLPSADLWFTFRLLVVYLSFTFRLPRLTAIQVIGEGELLGEPKLGAEC